MPHDGPTFAVAGPIHLRFGPVSRSARAISLEFDARLRFNALFFERVFNQGHFCYKVSALN